MRPTRYGLRSMSAKSSSSKGLSAEVRHDSQAKKYVMDLGAGKQAYIEYERLGSDTIDMHHTEVPLDMRKRGIGKALAEAAIKSARQADNVKVKLTCSFLVDYAKNYATDDIKRSVVVDVAGERKR